MKSLRHADTVLLSLILLAGPAAAFNDSSVRRVLGQAQTQLGASAPLALPKAVAARAGKTVATISPSVEETQLAEALDLQNQIREWLFANGQRMTKEVIAEAHGNFSAGFLIFGLIGGGSADGSYSAEAYKPLLEGGEQFVVTMLDDNTMGIIAQLDAADKTATGEQRCITQMRRGLQRFKDVKNGLPVIQAKLSRFQSVMTSLNVAVALRGDKMSPRLVDAFKQLMTWAKNSNVQLKEVGLAGDYTVKKASSWGNSPRGTLYLDSGEYHNCDDTYSFQQVVEEPDAVPVRGAGSLRIY